MARPDDTHPGKAPSQRQLRVGEKIRHALSDILMRGETHARELRDASITVSEVRVSPDLKNATAYIMPLGGKDQEAILAALKEQSGELRHLVGGRMNLRYIPKITFVLDTSYDEAQRIERLLKQGLNDEA